jgi:hypothetical protein
MQRTQAARGPAPSLLERGRKLVTGDEGRFKRAVIALAALAFALRLVIAAVTGGGNDLDIFHAFGALAADGGNPYHPPAGFPLDGRFGDNLPLEQLLFAAVLKIDDSAYALRVLFAAADAGVILLVGLLFPRPRAWRAAFVLFYAFNPLVLGSWTATAEDKTFLFLLLAGVVLAVELGRTGWSWAATTAIAALKGFSLFFAPMLALHTLRERGWRATAAYVGASAVVLALAHLPWFPDSLKAYDLRAAQTGWKPGHAAFTQVLDRIGLYDPAVGKIGTALLLVGIFLLFWRRLIGIVEAIVLASAATFVLQPLHSYPRVLLAALPFVFIVRLDARRWAILWAVSTVGAIGIYFQQERGELGGYGSLWHVLAAELFFLTLAGLYVRDKLKGEPAVVGQ